MLAAVPSLDVLLSCSDSVFAAMDKQGKLMYVSPTLTRVLNLMPSEALGCAMRDALYRARVTSAHTPTLVRRRRFDMDMVHPDDREKYESAFRSVLAAPARAPPAHVDVRLADVRLPDGSFMRVHVELCTDVRSHSQLACSVRCDAALTLHRTTDVAGATGRVCA